MRKTILLERPSLIMATLGGAAGTVFFASTVQVAAAAGVPAPGVAAALGGLWLGAIATFVTGWLILPLLLTAAWKKLPGRRETLPGALLKGGLFGVAVWALTGVALGVLGARGGWFGAAESMTGAVVLLAAAVGYGLIASAIASMGGGMAPLNALGWEGHSAGRAA